MLTSGSCIVCHRSGVERDGLCSPSCAADAHEEVRRNAARLTELRLAGAPAEKLRLLAERNGHLSAALMRWSPTTDSA